MLSFITILLPVGCTAKTVRNARVKKAAKIEFADSTARTVVGDSVYSILMDGKVKSVLAGNDGGIKSESAKYLSREDSHLLRFLLSDPKLYLGDVPVYGNFMPCIWFEFKKSGDENVSISLDLGLQTWVLSDGAGKELYRSALSTEGLLRFCHDLYPQDEFIKNHYCLKQR